MTGTKWRRWVECLVLWHRLQAISSVQPSKGETACFDSFTFASLIRSKETRLCCCCDDLKLSFATKGFNFKLIMETIILLFFWRCPFSIQRLLLLQLEAKILFRKGLFGMNLSASVAVTSEPWHSSESQMTVYRSVWSKLASPTVAWALVVTEWMILEFLVSF